MNLIKRTTLVTFAFFVTVLFAESSVLKPNAELEAIAKTLAWELPHEHLSRHNLDDAISKQTFENYLSLLDPGRVYFKSSDIKKFAEQKTLLDDELATGNVDFAYQVFNVLVERVKDRTKFVTGLLKKGFDLTIDENYHWNRKDAPWCKNDKEMDELWRKKIKNEYIQILISKELNASTNPICYRPNIDADEINKNSDEFDVTATNTKSKIIESAVTDSNLTAKTAFLYSPNLINPYYSSIAQSKEFFKLFKEKIEMPPELNLTPKESIQKNYDQYLGILEDSDNKWVLQKYLSAFARAYDPHSDYMSPESAADFNIEMKLSLCGIGAMLQPEDGAAKIMSLIPGGPADSDKSKNHLRRGDKIIAVAQGSEAPVSILHWPLYKAVGIIRGKKGSRVVLTVIPATDPSGTTTKKVTLIRDKVKLKASAAKSETRTLVDDKGNKYKLGIIDLPAFYADMQGQRTNPNYKSASRDVSKILRKMQDDNINGLILDLRNNGGGSLLEAVLMTGLFIHTGPTVQVRGPHNISILPDNNPSIAYSGPMIVLVNRLSASASEILAAALQDYGRAVIVGDSKTHGKGSVQTVLPLSRNAKMGEFKVTSALFYRISGGSTQLRGVIPDIVIPSAFEYMEFGEEYLPNPMPWTTIRSAIYSPYGDLSKTIVKLSKLSEARRKNEKQYIAYTDLLKRIKKMNSNKTFSLNYQKRLKEAQTEKELINIQNELMEQSDNGNESSSKDVVKEETLKILVDLINITSAQKKSLATGTPEN